jgi:hypothetical protein
MLPGFEPRATLPRAARFRRLAEVSQVSAPGALGLEGPRSASPLTSIRRHGEEPT